MPSYTSILNSLPVPKFKDRLLIRNHTTNDIIKEIQKSHDLYSAQGKYIYRQFMATTPYKTAKKIHSFLKDNIDYKIEPEGTQTSKSLSRYINDGFGDCKH